MPLVTIYIQAIVMFDNIYYVVASVFVCLYGWW